MTIEIGSQKVGRIGRRGGARHAPSIAIGEADANIFACPACSRPLGTGSTRCPGCGTRLIAGVRASRAAVFVGVGGFTGIILSAALMTVTSALGTRPVEAVVVPAPPVVTPTQLPIASVRPPVADPAIPSGALSALRQSTLLNRRVVSDADRLTAALAAAKPSSREIAPILRTMATTASFGSGLAPSVGEWDRADAVATDLAAFYAAISATAEEGLSASLSSTPAYIAAGERMLEIVAGLEALDAASRTAAGAAEVELPPLAPPS